VRRRLAENDLKPWRACGVSHRSMRISRAREGCARSVSWAAASASAGDMLRRKTSSTSSTRPAWITRVMAPIAGAAATPICSANACGGGSH